MGNMSVLARIVKLIHAKKYKNQTERPIKLFLFCDLFKRQQLKLV